MAVRTAREEAIYLISRAGGSATSNDRSAAEESHLDRCLLARNALPLSIGHLDPGIREALVEILSVAGCIGAFSAEEKMSTRGDGKTMMVDTDMCRPL